jgi:hypothetical protein
MATATAARAQRADGKRRAKGVGPKSEKERAIIQ